MDASALGGFGELLIVLVLALAFAALAWRGRQLDKARDAARQQDKDAD